ncbi:hypothetical protein B0T22DRAFT_463250 [Podospora appendiculata]|uniref:Cytochrome c oxidase assembly protein COX20, mitochondrial n=1 Tax=Podospora appendiculata TaxID=314037 RepID=A0AAE0XCS8_9PEZI|nr:hypothetical protein B0T22DRAFT_463250 [Podospora appendiculata]
MSSPSTNPSRDQAAPDPGRSWLSGASPTPITSSSTSPTTTSSPPPAPPSPTAQSQTTHKNGVSLTDVLHTIKPTDFLSVHEKPCSREGLLTGIGGGAAVGMLRWVLGAPVPRAANWGVGSFAVAALAQYEYCQYRRRLEREKMQRVTEVYDMNRKKAEQKAREAAEEAKRASQAKAEEEERKRARRRWYKFW